MSEWQPPRVFLIGAGPGDPGLLTLRAVECLAAADIVFYDKLVPERMLEFARRVAERVCVRDLGPPTAGRSPVHQAMLAAAADGKTVARLHGGDPLIFGRGGDEAALLREAGVPFEIVPGITAGLAAAAMIELPLTHRDHAAAVAIVAGHDHGEASKSSIDWPALAHFPGTLVIYMGFARLDRIVDSLITNGKAGDTPAAIVTWATTGLQESLTCPLAELPDTVRKAGFAAPAVLMVGPVVSLRPPRSWFEERPLRGVRVVVTRPRGQQTAMVRKLEQLGAVVQSLPIVEIQPPADWTPVDAAIRELSSYSWLAFTSANGVDAFLGRLFDCGFDARQLGAMRLAAIGPATAAALAAWRLRADVVPEEFSSEGLVNALRPLITGKRLLMARADRGRELLSAELSTLAEVVQVAVYRQVETAEASVDLFDAMRRGEFDYIALTSSNTARGLLTRLDEITRARIREGNLRLATISALTSAAVQAFGLPAAAEAVAATDDGLIEAILKDNGGRHDRH